MAPKPASEAGSDRDDDDRLPGLVADADALVICKVLSRFSKVAKVV